MGNNRGWDPGDIIEITDGVRKRYAAYRGKDNGIILLGEIDDDIADRWCGRFVNENSEHSIIEIDREYPTWAEPQGRIRELNKQHQRELANPNAVVKIGEDGVLMIAHGRVCCSWCGQYGEARTVCTHCGAPIGDE